MTETNAASQIFCHGDSKAEYERAHGELASDREKWERLQTAGVQRTPDGALFELRCCPACGSHINRRVEPADALVSLSYLGGVLSRSLEGLAGSTATAGYIVSPNR